MVDPRTITGTSQLPLTVDDVVTPNKKTIDLAVLKRGAKDYLEFLDATKEAFFAYLYHRTGSLTEAQTILSEVYVDSLARAMSIWRIGALTFGSLLDAADKALKDKDVVAADIDTVYLKHLSWLSTSDKKSVSTLHDALWSLPLQGQRLLILSLFVGLSTERIAAATRKTQETVESELETAKDLLLSRWLPTQEVESKLHSLLFIPSIDIQFETKLRFQVVEKYSALRFRRAQWVILGGLFAVLSNVIVASVLAVAVVTQPPTSLRGQQRELAGMDAILLQRQLALQETQQSMSTSFQETQRIVAHDVTRDFTTLGLAVALESLREQQTQERDVQRLLDIMKQAATVSFLPIWYQVMATEWQSLHQLTTWIKNIF